MRRWRNILGEDLFQPTRYIDNYVIRWAWPCWGQQWHFNYHNDYPLPTARWVLYAGPLTIWRTCDENEQDIEEYKYNA